MNASRKSGVADTIPFNNAAERAMFAGSDEGGRRAAIMYTLIETARLNDVDPEAWLGDVISRIADHPNTKIDELLPWKWSAAGSQASPHSGSRPSHRAYAAVVASLDVTADRGGATGHDRAHHAPLDATQMPGVGQTIRVAMPA
jgi:hypothetical protein